MMQSHKTVKSRTEYYIDITDEEKEFAGWEDCQKFDWKLQDDGSVLLKPWVKVDIGSITEYPREVLEMIIQESLDKDVTVNQVINDLLKESLKQFKIEDDKIVADAVGAIDPNFTNNDVGLSGGQQ